jgi:hypothetical protein
MSKKNPDTSAADEQANEQEQEYQQSQAEIALKRKEADEEEMSYLHAQSGLSFDSSGDGADE